MEYHRDSVSAVNEVGVISPSLSVIGHVEGAIVACPPSGMT